MDPKLEERLARIEAQLREIRGLVGPFGLAMPDGAVLVQTIYGLKYFVPADDDVMTPQLVVYRQWEREVSERLLSLVTPNTVFVDVGANFGYFTCLAASRIGTSGKGRVFAYEPNPKILPLLRRNVEVNWSMAPVTIIDAAASAVARKVRLALPGRHAANAAIAPYETGMETIECEAVTLDDSLPPGIDVDVMKIDVEGWEPRVLEGAERVLQRSPGVRIIMEWSPGQMQAVGCDPVVAARALAQKGFSVQLIEQDEPVSLDRLPTIPYANLLLQIGR